MMRMMKKINSISDLKLEKRRLQMRQEALEKNIRNNWEGLQKSVKFSAVVKDAYSNLMNHKAAENLKDNSIINSTLQYGIALLAEKISSKAGEKLKKFFKKWPSLGNKENKKAIQWRIAFFGARDWNTIDLIYNVVPNWVAIKLWIIDVPNSWIPILVFFLSIVDKIIPRKFKLSQLFWQSDNNAGYFVSNFLYDEIALVYF